MTKVLVEDTIYILIRSFLQRGTQFLNKLDPLFPERLRKLENYYGLHVLGQLWLFDCIGFCSQKSLFEPTILVAPGKYELMFMN